MNLVFGLGDKSPTYSKQFFGLTTIFGLGITRNLLGGIGSGVSFYNEGAMFPLYLDFRYNFNFGKTTVYAFGDGGLFFNISKSDDGPKFFINPGAGLMYTIRNNLYANMGAGLFLQTRDNQSRDSFVNFKIEATYILNHRN
jgi:hypothetical protein